MSTDILSAVLPSRLPSLRDSHLSNLPGTCIPGYRLPLLRNFGPLHLILRQSLLRQFDTPTTSLSSGQNVPQVRVRFQVINSPNATIEFGYNLH